MAPVIGVDPTSHERHERHKALINQLFTDDEVWADGQCQYWMGDLPAHFDYDLAHKDLYDHYQDFAIRASGAAYLTYEATKYQT